ncbi:MAG: hypothetical protein ACI9FJ_001853, partial [Alteromonadaceae bacterium]
MNAMRMIMNYTTYFARSWAKQLAAGLLLSLSLGSNAVEAIDTTATLKGNTVWGSGNVPAPQGIKKYIVFLADGSYQSVDGSIMLDGMVEGDGLAYQRKVMGRSEPEIEQHKNLAKRYFMESFGIDVDKESGVMFTGFQVDPRNHARAYTISGENISAAGWEMRMGGWGVFVMNPAGIDLAGDFSGVFQGSCHLFLI